MYSQMLAKSSSQNSYHPKYQQQVSPSEKGDKFNQMVTPQAVINIINKQNIQRNKKHTKYEQISQNNFPPHYPNHQQMNNQVKRNLNIQTLQNPIIKEQVNQSQSFMSNLIETPPFSPERRQKLLMQSINFQQNTASTQQYDNELLKSKQNFDHFLTSQNSTINYSDILSILNKKENEKVEIYNDQDLQKMSEMRQSIMIRKSKNNSCLNQQCLQTEICLLESSKIIKSLRSTIDDLYLQLLEKEGQVIELKEANECMIKQQEKKVLNVRDQNVQTSEELSERSVQQNFESISSLNQEQDSIENILKSQSQRYLTKQPKFHQPKLQINNKEILSPQHFKFKNYGQRVSVVESQIPLDIKFSIIYDDDNNQEDDENHNYPGEKSQQRMEQSELFSYSQKEDDTKISNYRSQSNKNFEVFSHKQSISKSDKSLCNIMSINTQSKQQQNYQTNQQKLTQCKTVKQLITKAQQNQDIKGLMSPQMPKYILSSEKESTDQKFMNSQKPKLLFASTMRLNNGPQQQLEMSNREAQYFIQNKENMSKQNSFKYLIK